MFFYRNNRRLERKLRGGQGRTASAQIVTARATLGETTNSDHTTSGKNWIITLRVQPGGEEPFEAKIKRSEDLSTTISAGTTVQVLYDPKNHKRVAIDSDPALTGVAAPGSTVAEQAEALVHDHMQEMNDRIAKAQAAMEATSAAPSPEVVAPGAAVAPPSGTSDAADAARATAQKMAANMETMPAPMRAMVTRGIKEGLDSMAPETRDAVRQIYQSHGIKV